MESKRSHGDAAATRYLAIDWSGAASLAGQRKGIVVADWHRGALSLTSGRTRAETISWLIEQSRRTPRLVAGLDFAFSYPKWFVQQYRVAGVEGFWQLVATGGEAWLKSCAPPFWGRPGTRCPPDHRAPGWRGYRRTDRLDNAGRQPSSPFQIGGAGAVGTGSLRGIPHLLQLRSAGFSLWPFHPAAFPMAMEIYPRLFTGPVNKSSQRAREIYLKTHLQGEHLDAFTTEAAITSEDAFDALCSVIGMARQDDEIMQLGQAEEETTLFEGAVFPGSPIAVNTSDTTES